MTLIQKLARYLAPIIGLGLMMALLGVGSAQAATKPYNIYRGPNVSSYLVLSFDDCPKSLKSFKSTVIAAEKMNIALVLFPTGDCIKSGKFDAAFARKHGHYVFNHSISHPNLTTLSSSKIKRQLGKPGVITNYGRPPYGAISSKVRKAYAAKHMRIWLWNVDTNDWRGKSRKTVVKYVVTHAGKGQTVLMHMQWNGFNATAIKQMKSGLAKRGLKVCRNYPGTTPVKLTGNLRC